VAPPDRLTCGPARLRRWRRGDSASLLAARTASDEHLRAWMPWAQDPPTEQAVLAYLELTETDWRSGQGFHYALISLDNDRDVLGSFSLVSRIGAGGLEIGYWVHLHHTGRGLATAAAAALTSAGFGLPDITHLEIHMDRENLASRAVPRKLGYTLVGTRDRDPTAPRDSGSDEIWRLTRADWPASSAASMCGTSGDPGGR